MGKIKQKMTTGQNIVVMENQNGYFYMEILPAQNIVFDKVIDYPASFGFCVVNKSDLEGGFSVKCFRLWHQWSYSNSPDNSN